MKEITVLVLAAGDSTRMWPLGDKHFLAFMGKPLIYLTLAQLYRFGFRNFIVVVNQENRSRFNNIGSIVRESNLKLVVQTKKRGMAEAVLSAREYLVDKKVLIVGPSDIFEDILFPSLEKQLLTDPDGIITGTTQESYFPGGYLKTKGDQILNIQEKPHPAKLPSHLVTFVFDYFKQANHLIEALEEIGTAKDDCFEQALNFLIKKGKNFKLLYYKGFWEPLKYPWHTLDISAYYLSKLDSARGKRVMVDKSAVITGKVYLGDNVRILENAKILGPAYIGSDTVIGNNALVRESMIGSGCVVGFDTEMTRSYIGRNCWFHSNYIGDSVLSNNVSLGAGTVLANFRLDEGTIKSEVSGRMLETGKVKLGAVVGDNVRIGVNASIMPGVKIGRNSFVGAGVVLDRDLANDKYCVLQKRAYLVKDNKVDMSTKTRKQQLNTLKFK